MRNFHDRAVWNRQIRRLPRIYILRHAQRGLATSTRKSVRLLLISNFVWQDKQLNCILSLGPALKQLHIIPTRRFSKREKLPSNVWITSKGKMRTCKPHNWKWTQVLVTSKPPDNDRTFVSCFMPVAALGRKPYKRSHPESKWLPSVTPAYTTGLPRMSWSLY